MHSWCPSSRSERRDQGGTISVMVAGATSEASPLDQSRTLINTVNSKQPSIPPPTFANTSL